MSFVLVFSFQVKGVFAVLGWSVIIVVFNFWGDEYRLAVLPFTRSWFRLIFGHYCNGESQIYSKKEKARKST